MTFSSYFHKHQHGRSMVEMLGVLAVIGVLSIGGLYAYRQAMVIHQTNLVKQLITQLHMALQENADTPNLSRKQLISRVCAENTFACTHISGNYAYFSGIENVMWGIQITQAQFPNAQSVFLFNLPPKVCQKLVYTDWGDDLGYMWINDHSWSSDKKYTASFCTHDYKQTSEPVMSDMYFYFKP